jgi:BirA family transcriptional regulator, biotin operon repressor / biotin---[acetyl-CoA-carboxylase] ligase
VVVGFDVNQMEATLETVQIALDATGLLPLEPKQLPKPPEFTIHSVDTVASTNQMLWELIDQGAAAGTVAIASQQQAGRGQWGRQWRSLPGGLYLSVGLRPQQAIAQAPQITLCSAWGIATALRQYQIPVQLKWLNDLVLNGHKLGGILTETRVRQGQLTDVVVGVGINWANPVPEMGIALQAYLEGQTLASLLPKDAQRVTSLEMLGAIALYGIMWGYTYWQRYGIQALIPPYEALLVNMGQQIELKGRSGQVVGINQDGTLRVRLLESHDPQEPCLDQSGLPRGAAEISVKPGMVQLGYGQHP